MSRRAGALTRVGQGDLQGRAAPSPPFGVATYLVVAPKGGLPFGRQGPPTQPRAPIGLALFLAPFAVGPPHLPNSIFSLLSLLMRGTMAGSTSFECKFPQFYVSL
jgi:hypothetical protein